MFIFFVYLFEFTLRHCSLSSLIIICDSVSSIDETSGISLRVQTIVFFFICILVIIDFSNM